MGLDPTFPSAAPGQLRLRRAKPRERASGVLCAHRKTFVSRSLEELSLVMVLVFLFREASYGLLFLDGGLQRIGWWHARL